MVRVNSGVPEANHRFDQWPRHEWQNLMSAKRLFIKTRIPYDCRCLRQFVEEAESMWRDLGYRSADDMIARGLDLRPEDIRLVYDWLLANEPADAVPLAKVLGRRGRPRKGDGKKGHNVTLNLRGNSRAYTIARLDRDRPDLATRVRAGTMSAYAAAKEAGFVKPRNGLDDLRRAWARATTSERATVLREAGLKCQPKGAR